ncbi:MAG: alkyl hydroperoxide reductase [SAR202 cluster bacterium Casp-Chloro-G4]|nr:MAG: alkyl hydroperoxide reductase [SAR202 cluster bacterium Casp-Chloro-G4]
MHVFPQLRKLEEKYRDEMTVIGVHSAKFTAEQDSANVRKAILRYEVEHPVVNDCDFEIWQQYGVRAWPTLMFVDPQGKIIGKHEGEIDLADFDKLLGDMVAKYEDQNLLKKGLLTFHLEKEKEWERPLSFPGKVLADAASDRLFIADSNHNRILVASLEGQVQQVIGSGEEGLRDGSKDEAQFFDPQGMALDGDTLYVADTKNHAIREVDLISGEVKTIAGTGQQARGGHGGGNADLIQLNSPWDLVLNEGVLYIAMAGFHQLWSLELSTKEARPYAGNGRERIVDGALAEAELAQPSGIATDGDKLYFTDSETSAIRTADLSRMGRVETIVGLHLFEFGDVDGIGEDVRLQHPIGIEMLDGMLYVTDTYNNKIKKINPATKEAYGFIGTGVAGEANGRADEVQFHEPAGISIAQGKMYIADTNNHAIRVADLVSLKVTTLDLAGL